MLKNILRTINNTKLIPTFVICVMLASVYGNSIWQLIAVGGGGSSSSGSYIDIFTDSYVWHIIQFSLWQAFLSSLLAIGCGLLTAHALFYHNFIGKQLLLKLFSLSMVLPVLVAIFGILGIYGRVGWITQIIQSLPFENSHTFSLNPYGLTGILIAHVFFNLPLATKIFLNCLSSIPNQQRQLASQLGVINWNFIHHVEWAYIRTTLPSVFTLIFMLCFTSFTIVLTLGGGPQYTTLEVAIFQVLTFDFELQKAAVLALIQGVFCISLFFISSKLSQPTKTVANIGNQYILPLPRPINIVHYCIIAVVCLFIALPIINIISGALNIQAWQSSLTNSTLYKAIGFSLCMAISAGGLCLLMSIGLLLGARQFSYCGKITVAHHIVNTGMIILALPSLVLAVGLFLLLQQFEIHTPTLFIVVVFCNALMAMPFSLRILTQPLYNNMEYYERLCQSLGIHGLARLRHIEWHTLKQPLQSAFALSSALSLGDFTAIALFGNNDFTSLPRLLYQQLGNYRSSEANVTAFILLVLCSVIFIATERYTISKK